MKYKNYIIGVLLLIATTVISVMGYQWIIKEGFIKNLTGEQERLSYSWLETIVLRITSRGETKTLTINEPPSGSDGEDEPTTDPWEQAIQDAQYLLQQEPSLSDNVGYYQSVVDRVDTNLRVLRDEKVRTVIDTVDWLQALDIPFVGNGWEILLDTLDVEYPGSKQALQDLDSALRDLQGFQSGVSELSELADLQTAVSTFDLSPTRESLLGLHSSMIDAQRILENVDLNVGEYETTIHQYMRSVTAVEEGLTQIEDIIPSRDLARTVGDLNASIQAITDPIQDLDKDIDELRARIPGDCSTMEQIDAMIRGLP